MRHVNFKVNGYPGDEITMEPGRRIYIAGPMRGIPNFNFQAFDNAQQQLEAQGWDVVNPAELDREAGFDPCEFPEDHDWFDLNQMQFSLDEAIARDVNAILDCDAMYMLDGWNESTGARTERALAAWKRLEIIYQSQNPEAECNSFECDGPASESVSPGIDQIPLCFLERLGAIFAEGEAKYGRNNWKQSGDDEAYERERLRHAIRHLLLWSEGDRSEDHLPKVAWFACTQIWREEQRLKEVSV